MADLGEVSSILILPTGDPTGDRREPWTSPRFAKRPLVQKSSEQEQPEEDEKHELDVTV
jgi:hypothetical protein